jgi:hypothetical protein
MEQVNINLYVQLGKSPTETHEMLWTACGDEALSWAQTFRWLKCFRDGREDMEEDPCRGPLKMASNPELVDKVRNLVAGDCWLTLRMMGSELIVNE